MTEFGRNYAVFIFQCHYQVIALLIVQMLGNMHYNFNRILCHI